MRESPAECVRVATMVAGVLMKGFSEHLSNLVIPLELINNLHRKDCQSSASSIIN